MAPNKAFRKTWRVQNIGTCTWDSDYAFIFIQGDKMQGEAVRITQNVAPGQTVDIPIDMITPSTPGAYLGYWMLRVGGKTFGHSKTTNKPFTVSVTVSSSPSGTIFNFASGACTAQWRNSNRELRCPGQIGYPLGFVTKVANTELENGVVYPLGLWTHPQFGYIGGGGRICPPAPSISPRTEIDPLDQCSPTGSQPQSASSQQGIILGTFPAIIIQAGDHFRVEAIGCQSGYTQCNVTFQVYYQVNSQQKKLLVEHNQVYDGNIDTINENLSPYANNYVTFSFRVIGLAQTSENAAMWIQPQIWR
jgi:hypothetical protein